MVVVSTTTPGVSSQASSTSGCQAGQSSTMSRNSTSGGSKSSSDVSSNNSDFFVSSLGCVLTHLVSLRGGDNDSSAAATATEGSSGEPLTVFHAVRVPTVSIHDYLFRIARYFLCSPECFVMALVYVDRVMKKHKDFVICKLNIHRLIVTSMMLAVKFFDDVYYSNAYYAKVGGVKGPEMNLLEVHLLKLIDWHLFVTPEEFDLYKTNVLVAVSGSPSPTPALLTIEPGFGLGRGVERERRPSIQRTRTEYDDEGYGVDDGTDALVQRAVPTHHVVAATASD